MNGKAIMGMELEIRVFNAFSHAGWECIMANSTRSHDITLTKNGKVFGYIEIYICSNVNAFKRKIERIIHAVKEEKPPVFILTDGITFETYFDGVYYDTLTLPVSYTLFLNRERLTEEIQGEDKDNG